MKYLFITISLLAMLAFTAQQKQKVIFFGDSISEAGAKPGGYIRRIDTLALKAGKQNEFEFIGAGIGGNKVYDLYLRLEKDVLAKKPDVVLIYVGVNDVWHKRMGTGTDADKFQLFYQALIDKIVAAGSKVILVTPAAIGEMNDNSNEQDGDLNRYAKFIRQLATKNKLPLVDLRKTFLEYNLKFNRDNVDRGILTTDGVHLNEKGNQLVAEEMWKVISANN